MARSIRWGGAFVMGSLAFFLAPPSADAQLSFNGCAYGGSSSFKVCASAETWYDSSAGTLFFKVINLNGSSATNPSYSDYASDTGGWGTITAIGLENMVKGVNYSVGSGGLQLSLNYWNGSSFDPINPTKWQVGANSLQIGGVGAATQGHRRGLVGGYNPGPRNANHLQTTNGRFAQFAISGFTGLSFSDDILFEWHTKQVANESLGIASRSAVQNGNSLKGSITPTVVVPEPITMVLLGSGLLGVGAIRRRRRDSDEDK